MSSRARRPTRSSPAPEDPAVRTPSTPSSTSTATSSNAAATVVDAGGRPNPGHDASRVPPWTCSMTSVSRGEPDEVRVEVAQHLARLAVDRAVALVDHDEVEQLRRRWRSCGESVAGSTGRGVSAGYIRLMTATVTTLLVATVVLASLASFLAGYATGQRARRRRPASGFDLNPTGHRHRHRQRHRHRP